MKWAEVARAFIPWRKAILDVLYVQTRMRPNMQPNGFRKFITKFSSEADGKEKI